MNVIKNVIQANLIKSQPDHRQCIAPAKRSCARGGMLGSVTHGMFGLGAFALGVFAMAAQDAQAKPLERELRYLVDEHPKILEAEKTLESRRASIDEAESMFLPRVSLTGEIGPQMVSTPGQRSDDGDPWGGVKRTAGLTVRQNIFQGFQNASQLRAAELNREVAAVSLEGTRQNTLFEGVRAYVDVLRQRRLVELSRENERTIQTQLNLEDERVRRGSGVTVDVLQAKSRLQIAKEKRVGYEGALSNAISTYEQVFGHAPDLPTMLDPAPPATVIPSSLERSIEIALNENPALLSGATTMEMMRERQRQQESGFYPTLDMVGDANFEQDNNASDGVRRDYSLSLVANWELYSGGATKARTHKGYVDYQASRDNYDFLASRIVEQTRLAWQSLITARERKELLGNAVNIAAEVFDSRRKLRDAGKETVINVLDAENEVNNAQINYTIATYDERVAIYQLLLAMGRLQPDYMLSGN